MLWNRKGAILLSVGVFLAAAALATWLLPEQWTAQTQVIVDSDESTTSLLSDLGLGEMAKSLSTASDDIQNKIYLATGKPIVDEVIWKLQLRKKDGTLYLGEDVGDAGLFSPITGTPSVEVTQTTGTDVIVIEAVGPTPETARLMADTLADVYIERQTREARAEFAGAQKFIKERLTIVEADLDASYSDFAALQRATSVIDLDAEQRAAVTRLSELTMQREVVFGEIKETRARIDSGESFNARESVDGVSSQTLTTNPIVGKQKAQLGELEQQRQALMLDGFTAKAPEIVEIDARLTAVKAALTESLATQQNLDPSIAALQANLAGLLERQRALTDAIERTQAEGSAYPDLRRRYNEIELKTDAAEEVYRSLQDQSFELGIAESMTMSDLRIVSRATLPTDLTSPKPVLNAVAGLVLGLLFGAATALLLEYVDDTVRRADDLRTVWDLPAFGAIPRYKTGLRPAVVDLPASDPLVEAHRAVRSAIEFANLDKPVHIVGITSSAPGEGKSTLAMALAIAAARDGRRVLLVDADLRLPTLHKRFTELRAAPGLVEVLSRSEQPQDAIQHTPVEGLDLLASGALPPNPGQLAESLRMRQVLLELSRGYDLVIVDTPPVLAVNDAVMLARAVDGMVVVIEAGRTTKRMLAESRARFEAAKVGALGFVLTKVASSAGGYGRYTRYYQRPVPPGPAPKSGTPVPTERKGGAA